MGYLHSAKEELPYVGSLLDTSHDAAVHAETFAPLQRDRYLTWLTSRGDRGGTDYEAHVALGISRQSICARRNEHVKSGRVLKVVGKRRKGQHGISQQVWRVPLPSTADR